MFYTIGRTLNLINSNTEEKMEKRTDLCLEGIRLEATMLSLNPIQTDRLDKIVGKRGRSKKIRELIASFLESEETKQNTSNPAA
jgi:hypothetical protein